MAAGRYAKTCSASNVFIDLALRELELRWLALLLAVVPSSYLIPALKISSGNPSTDAAGDFVGDCAGKFSNVFRADRQFAFTAKQGHLVIEGHTRNIGYINERQIHRDATDHRSESSMHNHATFVGKCAPVTVV